MVPSADGEPYARDMIPRRRRPGGRHALLAVLAALVVAGVLIAHGAQGAPSLTAGVADGRVGSMPVVPDLLWQAPDSSWSVLDGDVLALGTRDGFAVRDLRTGAVVVERRDAGDCGPVRDSSDGSSYPVVLCTTGPSPEGGIATVTSFTAGGEELWQKALDVGSGVSAAAAVTYGAPSSEPKPEPDVVWLAGDADHLHLTRMAGTDGVELWSVELELVEAVSPSLQVLDTVALVSEEIAVDLATGAHDRYEPPWAGDESITVVEIPSGSARETYLAGSVTVTVLDETGAERFTLPDASLLGRRPLMSDQADLLMVTTPEGHAVAVDAMTGVDRWRVDDHTFRYLVALLPDVVVVTDGDRLRALDGRTGDERWAVPVGEDTWSTSVVDERRIITGADVAGRTALTAFDAPSGDLVWEVETPSPVQELHTGDGVLVVQTYDGTMAFPTG